MRKAGLAKGWNGCMAFVSPNTSLDQNWSLTECLRWNCSFSIQLICLPSIHTGCKKLPVLNYNKTHLKFCLQWERKSAFISGLSEIIKLPSFSQQEWKHDTYSTVSKNSHKGNKGLSSLSPTFQNLPYQA